MTDRTMRVLQNGKSPLAIELESERDTERLGVALAEVLPIGSVVGLIGPLGAGKTRLVRAIVQAFGVHADDVSSPTFVLIHEYTGRVAIYHFDAYRLGSASEFEALGAAEYFGGDGISLVEWADRVEDAIPATAWRIDINYGLDSPTGRHVTLQGPPDRLDVLVQKLTAEHKS